MEILKGIHNILRWIVLFSAFFAVFTVFSGMIRRQAWGRLQHVSGLIFSSAVGLQLVIGLVLYGISPLTRGAMTNMSAAMKNPQLRFYAVEHITIMILAFGIAQVGYSLSKRNDNDKRKYLIAGIAYSLSIVLIILGIPWKYSPLFPNYLFS